MKAERSVLVIGGGEFGSAIAWYLHQAQFPVSLVFRPGEMHLRRPICFGEAAFTGRKTIDGVSAVLISPENLEQTDAETLTEQWERAILFQQKNRVIPAWLESDFKDFLSVLHPGAIILSEPEIPAELDLNSAELVIGLFPHHQPGRDCHLSVETRQNYFLGTVYSETPPGRSSLDRHFFHNPFEEITAPLEGLFVSGKNIGGKVRQNEPVGTINNIEIRSPYDGQIWGIYHSGKMIPAKQTLALVYTGAGRDEFAHFGFQHRAVGGAVLRELFRFSHNK